MSSVLEIPEVVDEVPAGKSVMCVLDQTGDSKFIWDPSSPDEVEAARQQFDKLKAKGYMGYAVKEGGDKGSVLSGFDATAGKIIMAKPLVGG